MRKMLTPQARAIGRPAGPAQDDAVDPAHATGTATTLKDGLTALIGPGQVLHRVSDLVRYASDASPYRYLPQVVVLPRTVDDVRAVLAYCARTGRHATFRAGGTSLNGQSQSDDILIDVRRHWAGMAPEDGGQRLRARPGTILGHANAVGIALADRDLGASRAVIGLIGDGSSQYSVQALWTAAQHQLPIVYVIMRNDEYSILKSFAVLEQTPGVPGLDLPGLGIAALARGWGCRAVDVETTEELEQEFKTALAAGAPTVIVVRTQPQQAML